MPTTVPAPLNPDLVDTGTPPIPEAQGWARRYDGRSGPLIDLSQAVPGLPPPQSLLEAHADAAREAASAQYGPITGDAALRAAFAGDLAAVYGHAPNPDEIAITSGCNQAFVVAMLALAQAGERVAHGGLTNEQALSRSAHLALGQQGVQGHQQVQVDAAKVGVANIDFIHETDVFNRFA